ncbi:MAG: glycoside hydrolase family 76 protein [Gaiellaceae bacterium]|jgi:hypothetical protein
MLHARTRGLAAAVVAAAVSAGVASVKPAPAAAARAAASGDRAAYLAAAEQSVAQIKQRWWNGQLGWFDKYPTVPGDLPLATAWDAFPVIESYAAIALADPTPANRAAAVDAGVGAERYWNPAMTPLGGFTFYPDLAGQTNSAFFDDTGWLGVAFFDAYRATKDPRFLRDAIRAFRFIDIAGWAGDAGGGVWWDTEHQYKTAEPLAAAALLGAEIYQQTHIKWYLKETKKLIAWADLHSWNRARGLYARSDVSDVVMNYVEGMMIGAQVTLCRATRDKSRCLRAEQLARAASVAFPADYHWAPETDVIYLRWLLDLYGKDRNARWYGLVDAWAQRALANAKDARGLYTKRWDGTFASNDRLLTIAATTSLFAWVAASPPAPR